LLPNLPSSAAGQVKKSTTLESLPLTLLEQQQQQQQQQQRLMMQNQNSRTSLTTVGGGMVRSASEDTLDQKSDAASRAGKV
jgi:hypothetical protein